MATNTNVLTAAQTTFAISAALPATHDITGFEALTYTNIGEVIDGGSAGKSFNKVDYSPLASGEVLSLKGSFTQGTRDLQLGLDVTDAGQIIVISALDSFVSHAFKITFQDGSVIYYTATVDSYTTDIGTIDSIVGSSVSMAQNLATVRLTVTGALTASVNAGGTFTGVTDAVGLVATQASTTGSGTGAVFSVTLDTGAVTAVAVTETGFGYIVGETVTLLVVGSTESVAATVDIDTIVVLA